MMTLLAIVVTGCGTYFSRSIFILALARRQLPPRLMAALEFVAPAVFGALIVTMMVTPEGELALGLPEAVALTAAAVVAAASRNHIYTLVAGMAMFWLVRLF